MVRTYVKKTVRGHYGNKNLEDALKAINDGTPLIRASKEHGIPARTLRRHRDKRKSGTTRKGCFGKTPARVETELQDHIQMMERSMHGLTVNDVWHLKLR